MQTISRQGKSSHVRLVEKIQRRVAANERAGRATDMSRRDYRWWEAIKAGVPVHRPDCFEFWCSLHFRTRETYLNKFELLTVSPQDRSDCAKESREFFRKARNNPKLERRRDQKCHTILYR